MFNIIIPEITLKQRAEDHFISAAKSANAEVPEEHVEFLSSQRSHDINGGPCAFQENIAPIHVSHGANHMNREEGNCILCHE